MSEALNNKTDVARKSLRWYFSAANQPQTAQSQGVSVKVWQTGLFGSAICLGVVKDMSMGGAGILVPTIKEIPEFISIEYDNVPRIKAQVVYRRAVSKELQFLGVSWVDAKRDVCLALLRKLSKKAYRESRVTKLTEDVKTDV